MACVAAESLSKEQKDELLCTYAALVLHDDGADVTPDAMNALIKASGCSVEAYWPSLMSKMVNNVGMDSLFASGGGAGAGAGPIVGGATGGESTAAGGGGKEEKKVEE